MYDHFDISGNHLSGFVPSFNYNFCLQLPSLSSDLLQPCNSSFTYMSYFMHKARHRTSLLTSAAQLLMIHNFSVNNFTGPICWLPVAPERLGRQTDYAFLADANKLTGSFPGRLFGKCNKLHGMIVNLSNNKIVGHIPLNIGAMCKSLRVLDVFRNQIFGIVPQSLGNLKSLVLLDLRENKLQGQIPASFHRLKYLRHLSLAGNNLTGGIPLSIGQLRSPKVLELSSKFVCVKVPEAIVNLRNLTGLLLNNNKLSGHIPSGLAHVTSLSTFNASFNNLSGSFLWNGAVMNCSGIVGNPFLDSCQMLSLATSSSEQTNSYEDSQNNIAPTRSRTEDNGTNSIETGAILSASAIVLVLLVLVILFFCTRKRVQVSESREPTLFVNIGVPLTYETIVQATGNFNSSNCIGRFQGVEQFHEEIKTLGSVNHANLVTVIGYHASENEMFLIHNYLPGGNLENFMKARSARAVPWKILHKIALNIASALAYLHDHCAPRVLHWVVKPSNILLDDESNAYLSDFGLCRLLGISETHATTGVAGTFGYLAPEYAMTCRVSKKADVNSYGIVLLELVSDKMALDPSFSPHGDGFNIVSWAWMLLQQHPAKDVFTAGLWDTSPQDDLVDMLHLALRCTVDTPSTRPTMKQVVQYLKKIQPSPT